MRTSGLWIINDGDPVVDPPSPKGLAYPFRAVYQALPYTIYVANQYGRLIGELGQWGTLQSAIWRHNAHGTATILLANTIVTHAPYLLERGNRVLIQFADGRLPTWGGIIDPPINPTQSNIQVTCYSAEYLAQLWSLRSHRTFLVHTRGEIIAGLWADTDDNLGEVYNNPADISMQGKYYREEYAPQMLAQALEQATAFNENLYWYLEPVVIQNTIRFSLHVYYGYLKDKQAVLMRGRNFNDVELMEQGPIHNWVAFASHGDNEPFTAIVEDVASVSRYGRRSHFATVSDTAGNGMNILQLTDLAEAYLQRHRQPLERVRGSAIDMPPSRFGAYELGDRVIVELTSLFNDSPNNYRHGRIRSMEYAPPTGKLDLVIDLEQPNEV